MTAARAAVTGVILAGGHSRRMGRDKALLDLGGRPMIGLVADTLAMVCEEVIIVDREPGRYAFLGLPVVVDRQPGYGPLSGLHAGLLALRHPYGLFVACDMPFLQPAVLRLLIRFAGLADDISGTRQSPRRDGRLGTHDVPGTGPCPAPGTAGRYDAVVPRRGDRPEPLHALYGHGLLPAVEALLARGGGPLRAVLAHPGVRVRWVEEPELRAVDPGLRSLVNVNTPEEYRQVIKAGTS